MSKADESDASGGLGVLDLSRLMDVQVELSVELGRKKLALGQVVSLAPGAIVEFAKASDESLDIRINEKLVARGEAVLLGDRYGVRVTEILKRDPQENPLREAKL